MIEGHGDDSYKFKKGITSNFSSNIFPHADLSGLKAHLCKCMSSISSYPEPEPYTLEKKLAEYHHIPPGNVLVTNGATEAIYLIAQAFQGARSFIKLPTFSEYKDACLMHAHKMMHLPGKEFKEEVCRKFDLMWFCNPDNPTGGILDKAFIRLLLAFKPCPLMIFDQSYESFTEKEILSPKEAIRFRAVIQIHSMTKRYGIPGLRLGYITAQAPLIKKIRACRMPWSVNRLAAEAGYYLLDKGLPEKINMKAYLEEARRFEKELASLDIDVFPSNTHFILAGLRNGSPAALKKHLAEKHGVLIRDASNFEGTSGNMFRVAAQTPEENDRLVQLIREWLETVRS